MVVAAKLVAQVTVQGAAQAKSELAGVSKSVSETSGGFKAMLGNALSFAAGQAIFTLAAKSVGFLKDQTVDAVKVAMAHQDIMVKTTSILKQTKDASGQTADSIEKMATALSHTTTFSKDSIIKGQDMLLTFTSIGKQVFPLATQSMLNMSKTMGIDASQAAIMLGKAMDDPVKGISALHRVGVSFTDQQKAQIAAMVKSGDTMGAQKIILAALNGQMANAQDASKTLGGQWAILGHYADDVKEAAGNALLPVLQRFTGWVASTALPTLSRFSDWFSTTAMPVIKQLSTYVAQNVQPILLKLNDAFQKGAIAVKGMNFADIVAAVQKVYPGIKQVADIIGGALSTNIQFAIKWGKQISLWFQAEMLPALQKAMPSFMGLGNILINTLAPALAKAWATGQQMYRLVASDLIPIFEKVAPIVVKIAGYLADNLGKAIVFLTPIGVKLRRGKRRRKEGRKGSDSAAHL